MTSPGTLAPAALLVLATLAPTPAPAQSDALSDAQAVNRRLGRGINLGNALEAPRLGAWGMDVRPEYFRLIAEAGFDSVRVPIRWSAHAGADAPYAIDPEFFAIVDGVVDQCLANGLAVVVNFHHYEELYADPDGERPRFLALWRQVAERYRDRPSEVVFELLNEPHGALSHERWQALFPEALAVVRASNPRRAVLIGPGNWNNVNALPELELPEDDRMLLGTFHYYLPFPFTHQGATWAGPEVRRLRDIPWDGTPGEAKAIADDFDKAAAWSKAHDRPVYVGEFGAYSTADMASRARWTAAVAGAAVERGFSFAYWEFGSGFGAYDREEERWHAPLKDALVPSTP